MELGNLTDCDYILYRPGKNDREVIFQTLDSERAESQTRNDVIRNILMKWAYIDQSTMLDWEYELARKEEELKQKVLDNNTILICLPSRYWIKDRINNAAIRDNISRTNAISKILKVYFKLEKLKRVTGREVIVSKK